MSVSPTAPSDVKRRQFLRAALSGAALAPLTSAAAEPENKTSRGQVNSSEFEEPARHLPLKDDVDVIVCGAGPAGVVAAIVAARSGARVRLMEVHGCLGGVWTAGLLSYVLDANKEGFNQELMQRLKDRSSLIVNSPGNYFYDPEEMKILLEEMCLEAGVKIQLFTRVVAAHKDSDNRLTTIITESKSGRQAWKARVFIDATGDGDLGAYAGCKWEIGESKACPCQPMTMMAMIVAPNPDALRPFASHYNSQPGWRKEPVANLKAELARVGLKATYGVPSIFHVRERLFNLMINHEYGILAYDNDAVTEATLRARAEIHRVVRGLRSLGGVWDGLQLVATAEQIGIRDGRRIRGRYMLTKDDLIEGRQQPDAVTRSTFNVDIHATSKEMNDKHGYHNAGVKTKPYDIPLRAMIAADVDGLMMAGRCISGDFISHASYRVTGNAVGMGEGAGAVAALAALTKRLPQAVEWSEGLAKLKSLGLRA